MPGRLLLVDDDRFILNHLARLLSEQGYRCATAVTAEEAWHSLDREPFDLMLLDIGLPDTDGLTFCRRVRSKYRLPIIMLTARDGTADKIVGLELGADDYIVTPFEPAELIARVRAQIRRHGEYDSELLGPDSISIGDLVIDLSAREVRRSGKTIVLTGKEFDLLHALARNRGRALSRDWLFENVWGWDAELGGQALPVVIRRLRCKIEPDPDRPVYILTIRGFGYKMESPGEG